MRPVALPIAFFSLATLAAPLARATVLVDVSIEDMAFDADLIAIGQVIDVGTRLELSGQSPEPWTVTTLRVERVLGGATPSGATLAIEERGGTLRDGSGMRIDGTPEYREGERVLVFLRKDDRGRFRTWGMKQGRFVIQVAVDGPTRAIRDLDDVGLAHWANGAMVVDHGAREEHALDALLARIARAREAR